MKTEISLSTIRRLPIYLHYLKSLDVSQPNISATQIAGALNLGEVQVRKDLASISCGGKPKVGYEVHKLINELESYLGANDENSAVIVGVGRLGQALLEYDGFAQFGLEIVAGFDVREELFGKNIGGKPIFDEKQISGYVKDNGIAMAIITVPASFAQSTADKLVSVGIKAIWNFSPTHIVVPDTVVVKNENLAASLAVLSKQLKEK
ncbi:MAG: redox-sensing transcriptional repressor Rex [Clostridia bacterium]|nr:redox-sensing transcriptional repressor Rex [Clostridia bacterium]